MLESIFGKKIDFNELRKDFTVLNRTINDKPIIYFDNACMSLRPKQVLKVMNEYYNKFPGCAGRSNHTISEEVNKAVEKARESIAKFFHAKPEAVVFTKNCTEAINLVANAFPFENGDVVLTTDKEHNSNLIPWLRLQKKWLIKHDVINSEPKNIFSTDELIKKLNQYKGKIKLVSVVYTSNLDGVSNPVKDIIRICHKHKVKVLLDCSQSALHHEINIKKLDADFIAVSSHKMLGPNGVGALISTKENLEMLDQFLVGGETVQDSSYDDFVVEKIPERFEAGLQNYPGIIGFGEAIKYLDKIGFKNIHEQLIKLNSVATAGLSEIKNVKILGPINASKRSGIISFVIKGKKVHEVSLLLNNMHNIMVRSGAHCVHSWFNKIENKESVFKDGTVRASFGFYNTIEEVEIFVKAVKEISEL
ncbi:cysteine desulfurase [Candidatus Woesearchaeota archaeon]|jgi:cysteine desulfurase / selenocysteine lyase|nr:cysteine desulfurase [Candidatus Woesearchaeota archaeon]MBT4110937.1 cysteine desulfurase [Candidatus Woesearchaeota archaeon]MBT4336551.1 cysteine desulfurase [Candidatus Woesearchaeota archaeon]MBT4469700.1 cysteine desulfurase [Candidatus Woesearchaeota archaeon]MBT6744062.1 cysteine desulfurase [Candidatus Woesearchaeota archaeon]